MDYYNNKRLVSQHLNSEKNFLIRDERIHAKKSNNREY